MRNIWTSGCAHYSPVRMPPKQPYTTSPSGNPERTPTPLAWLSRFSTTPLLFVPQGRTKDAIFQIEKGLEEAKAVGEVIMSSRLRRLRAQVNYSGSYDSQRAYLVDLNSQHRAIFSLFNCRDGSHTPDYKQKRKSWIFTQEGDGSQTGHTGKCPHLVRRSMTSQTRTSLNFAESACRNLKRNRFSQFVCLCIRSSRPQNLVFSVSRFGTHQYRPQLFSHTTYHGTTSPCSKLLIVDTHLCMCQLLLGCTTKMRTICSHRQLWLKANLSWRYHTVTPSPPSTLRAVRWPWITQPCCASCPR